MDDDKRLRDEGEWTIEGIEDRKPSPVLVWIAIGGTVAAVVGAFWPEDSDWLDVGTTACLVGALCGLVTGVRLVLYRSSRRIGVCCALISLILLALFFPFIMLKGGLMGDG